MDDENMDLNDMGGMEGENHQEDELHEEELSDIGDLNFDEVEMSEMMPSSLADEDIQDYDLLKDKTKKLKLHSEDSLSVKSTKIESADEFLRNFFIKFGMTKTLESFQLEFYEKKANGEKIEDEYPEVYAKNIELTDELVNLHQELNEARVITEKAKSTYDKLIKQKDYQKN